MLVSLLSSTLLLCNMAIVIVFSNGNFIMFTSISGLDIRMEQALKAVAVDGVWLMCNCLWQKVIGICQITMKNY